MTARLATTLGAFVLMAACGPANPRMGSPAVQGTGGMGTGGDGGDGGAGGMGGSGASGGTGGTRTPDAAAAGTGGAGGSGGTGGGGSGGGGASGADAGVDAPAKLDGAADGPAPDGPASTGDGHPDGEYWQVFCPDTTPRMECCTLYCGCMMKNCMSQLPANCMATCLSTTHWDLPCRVHNCFLSISPNSPQDHDSHCGHANGKNGKCTDH